MSRIALLAVCGSAALLAQSGTGSIEGTVVIAATRHPLAGAFVSVTRTTLPPLRVTVRSGDDGSFLAGGLPKGTYTVCVQPSGSGYLDPCVWTEPVPTVTLAEGQKVAGQAIEVQSGSVIKIHLDDPGGLLRQKSQGAPPQISIGVQTPQASLQPARLVASSVTGADFEVSVPREASMVLAVQSFDLRLADSRGTPLGNAGAGNGARQGFKHAAADGNAPSFTYKITGTLR